MEVVAEVVDGAQAVDVVADEEDTPALILHPWVATAAGRHLFRRSCLCSKERPMDSDIAYPIDRVIPGDYSFQKIRRLWQTCMLSYRSRLFENNLLRIF